MKKSRLKFLTDQTRTLINDTTLLIVTNDAKEMSGSYL